jgi:hypothetical protein
MFGSTVNDPTPEFVEEYRRTLVQGSPHMETSRKYIRRVREEHGRYEGVVRPSAKPALAVNPDREAPWTAALAFVRNYRRYRSGEALTDNHVPDPLRSLMFAAVINPARAAVTGSRLRSRYINASGIRRMAYAFYPLHTEPEVSLLVYGRPFLNQIEVIRQIAVSLPVHMQLIVKEHPWMVGKRSHSFYRKLLNIPRVHIARPDIDARDLVADAALVTVITGSVALEAAMLKKPVITLGACPFTVLPVTMVAPCSNVRELPSLIRTMLGRHEHDEAALESYVATVFELSESVNLYSVLLEKKGVHHERTTTFAGEVQKLADYMLSCMQGCDASMKRAAGAL